ncbi:hypothetical protein KA344_05240 [bacterium]|nr:hypothetical protein [bacterium]
MAVNCVSLFVLRAIAFVATIFVASVLVTSIFVTSMPGASAEESNSLPRCTKKRVSDREVSAMSNLSDAEYSQKLAILRNAKQLCDSVVGESAIPSQEYQAFLHCAPRVVQHKKEVLDSMGKSTAAGKVYLVTLLYAIDNKSALEELKSLQTSKETVVYKSGCEVFHTSLGAIAADLLKSGRYLGWTLGSK